MNINLPIVGSPSRAETAARCQRRHFVHDVLCLRRKERDEAAVSVGTVVHAGAAEWWKTGDLSAALLAARRRYHELAQWFMPYDELTPGFVADHLVRRYTDQATLTGIYPTEGAELVSVEQRIVLPLGAEATLSFQADRVLRYNDGTYVVIDTKTARRLDAYWRKRWRVSLQQKLYHWGVYQYYGAKSVVGAVEGLQKDVAARLEYVQTMWTDGELEEAVEFFKRMVQDDAALVAVATEPDGSVNLNKLYDVAINSTNFNPADCWSYGKECELYELCTSDPAYRVGLLTADFEYVEPDFLE